MAVFGILLQILHLRICSFHPRRIEFVDLYVFTFVRINHGMKCTVKQLQNFDAQGRFARALVDLNGVRCDMVVTSAAAFDFARKLCDEYDRRKKDLFAFHVHDTIGKMNALLDCKCAARKKKLWTFPKRKDKQKQKTTTKMALASTSEWIRWNLEFQTKTYALMAGMGQVEKWPRLTMQNMKTPWKNLTDKRKNKNMNVARLQKYDSSSFLIFNCTQSFLLVAVELRQKTWSGPMVYVRPWTRAQLPATTYWLFPGSCKRMAESWHLKKCCLGKSNCHAQIPTKPSREVTNDNTANLILRRSQRKLKKTICAINQSATPKGWVSDTLFLNHSSMYIQFTLHVVPSALVGLRNFGIFLVNRCSLY